MISLGALLPGTEGLCATELRPVQIQPFQEASGPASSCSLLTGLIERSPVQLLGRHKHLPSNKFMSMLMLEFCVLYTLNLLKG